MLNATRSVAAFDDVTLRLFAPVTITSVLPALRGVARGRPVAAAGRPADVGEAARAVVLPLVGVGRRPARGGNAERRRGAVVNRLVCRVNADRRRGSLRGNREDRAGAVEASVPEVGSLRRDGADAAVLDQAAELPTGR